MSVTVVFHRLAVADFVAGRRWYARASRATENRFVANVQAAVARILAAPAAGSPSVPPCRWVKVSRFPYLLYYRPIGADEYEVVAVAHASRRPGYWLRRVRRP